MTTPFFRKKAGGITLGFRTDRELTAPVRKVLADLWEKMPYDGVRGSLEGFYKRRGVEVGERLARQEIGAWEVDGALKLAQASVRALKVADAPGELQASLKALTRVAKDQGVDAAESYTALARMLDEGFDVEKLRRSFTTAISDDMVTAIETAHKQTAATLKTIHTALKRINPNMGDMGDYFPLLASNDFQSLLKTMAEGGVDEAATKAMARALAEGVDDLTADQRLGLQILSQFNAKYTDELQIHRVADTARGDTSVHMNSRIVGKSLFSPLGGVEMGLLNKQVLRDLAEEGAEIGWASRVELNRVVKAGLAYLQDVGGLGKLKKFEPFSMDLPDVLNSYVRSTSRVIHFNALVDEATRLGIVGNMDEALDIGQTIAEALAGPLSKEAVQLRLATRRWLMGDAGQPSMQTLDVIEGWAVKLPAEVAKDARVAAAFKKLREQSTKATKQTAAHRAAMEVEVRKLIDVGVDEAVARDLAVVTTDPVLRETQAALFAALADESAKMRASMQDLLARVDPEKRVDTLKLADALTEEWMQVTRQTIRDLRRQWEDTFSYQRHTADGVVDLLAPTAEGAVPLAEFVAPIERAVDDLLEQRALSQLAPEARQKILQAGTTGDMKLSLVRALDEIANDDIIPQGAQKAWKAVRDTVITSKLTATDLVEEVGARRAVEIMQHLSGFKPPASTVDDLADLASDFAIARGSSYVPREAGRLGNAQQIWSEYDSLANVTILDDVNGVVAHQFLKFRNESIEQIERLRNRGYQFIPYDGPGMPYKSLREQVTDIVENRRLLIPTSTNDLDPLPFNQLYGEMPIGNLIDGLHIVMGHAMHDFDGTMQGITSAWLAHGQMYSDDARGIFTTLTRGRRTSRLHTNRVQPRKIGVMDPSISDLNLDDWAANSDFAVLAAQEDFADALRLGQGMDALPSELKTVEGNHALSVSVVPGKDAVPGDDFYARVITADGREIKFKQQREFEQWQQSVKTEKLTAGEKMERAATRAEGRVEAAKPIPAPSTKRLAGEELTDAVSSDIDALRAYRSEVKAWQAHVYDVAGPSGQLNKKAWRQTKEWIREQYERAQRLTVGEDLPAERAQALAEEAPLASTATPEEFRTVAAGKKVTPEEFYGLQPPPPPTMKVLGRQDVDSFPLHGEHSAIDMWAEQFDDPETWMGVRFEGELVEGEAAREAYDFIQPLGTVDRVAVDVAEGTHEITGGNIGQAVKQLRDDARQEALDVRAKITRGAEVTLGKPGEPALPAQLRIGKAAGESEILAAGLPITKFEDAVTQFEAYNELLRQRWVAARKALTATQEKFGEILKDFDLPAMFEEMDDSVLRQAFDHHTFKSGVMEDLATAGNKKLGVGQNPRTVAKQHLKAIEDETRELADAKGLRGMTDGQYLHPTTNVMEEIKRALVAGDATTLARYEDDVRELLEMIGLDGERILFEPLEDGTFRLQYLTGEFQTVDHTLPPEALREELAKWIPYPTAGLSTQKLASLAARLVDDGLLSLEVMHPSIKRFLTRVPNGVLPVEAADFDYLRRLLPQLFDVREQFKTAIPAAARNQKGKAAKALEELLDMVEPFVRRRVGDADKLDEAWDASRKTLERVLSEEDFGRISRLVEQAPVIRSASAKSRMGTSGSVGRRWRPAHGPREPA